MNSGQWSVVRTLRLVAGVLMLALFLAAGAGAQYVPPYVAVTGTVASANGMPAANYGITFTPTQVMFVGGTSLAVSAADCATDVNGGMIGLSNPLTPAIAAPLYTGTLAAGNYVVQITWYDTWGHQTLPSPAVNVQLTSPGAIVVSPPTSGTPPQALGMDVYIGPAGSAPTYQGQTTNPTASFTQSAALTTGAALPIQNGTVCGVVANDAAWPIAGYIMNMVDASGNTLPGFPKQVQFVGPGSAYNISNGLPLWNGATVYPVPVITVPYNHNAQSISGSLSLSGYNLFNVGRVGVGTAVPGWGVDAEGSGVGSEINAGGGFLVNGSGGTNGYCLGSNGTVYGVEIPCLTSATLYYQTVEAAGVAQPQEPALNFAGAGWTLTDTTGISTAVTLNLLGTGTSIPAANAMGTVGDCVQWTVYGVGDAGFPCLNGSSPTATDDYFKATGCAIDNSGNLNSCGGTITFTTGGNTTPSFAAMPDTVYEIFCTVDTGTQSSAAISVAGSTSSGNTPAFTRTTSTFQYEWTEIMANSAAGSAAPVLDCHLHHN